MIKGYDEHVRENILMCDFVRADEEVRAFRDLTEKLTDEERSQVVLEVLGKASVTVSARALIAAVEARLNDDEDPNCLGEKATLHRLLDEVTDFVPVRLLADCAVAFVARRSFTEELEQAMG
jgi:hypothetical protein